MHTCMSRTHFCFTEGQSVCCSRSGGGRCQSDCGRFLRENPHTPRGALRCCVSCCAHTRSPRARLRWIDSVLQQCVCVAPLEPVILGNQQYSVIQIYTSIITCTCMHTHIYIHICTYKYTYLHTCLHMICM